MGRIVTKSLHLNAAPQVVATCPPGGTWIVVGIAFCGEGGGAPEDSGGFAYVVPEGGSANVDTRFLNDVPVKRQRTLDTEVGDRIKLAIQPGWTVQLSVVSGSNITGWVTLEEHR